MSDTNTNKGVLDAEENKVNLVKISACISQKIDTVIRDMADEYGVSFSEVLRLAIDGHLEQYLGQVQYMDAEQGKKKQNIKPDFDYALVPGPVFVKTKSGLWNCEQDRLLMMGYPRYDWMLHPSMNQEEILERLFGWKGRKAVIWMPTFRKSELGGCAENEIELPCQLPGIRDEEELKQIDAYLRREQILLIIKKHPLQTGWDQEEQGFTNIRYVSEDLLDRKEVRLYELIGVCDGLLSDYSSVAVDYLLLNRPLGYVLADYEIYKEKRGFVFDDPLEYMPGEKIYNAEDMIKYLKHLSEGTDTYMQERAQMLLQMHNKTESYCKRLAEYLL